MMSESEKRDADPNATIQLDALDDVQLEKLDASLEGVDPNATLEFRGIRGVRLEDLDRLVLRKSAPGLDPNGTIQLDAIDDFELEELEARLEGERQIRTVSKMSPALSVGEPPPHASPPRGPRAPLGPAPAAVPRAGVTLAPGAESSALHAAAWAVAILLVVALAVLVAYTQRVGQGDAAPAVTVAPAVPGPVAPASSRSPTQPAPGTQAK
jgi:hypothetical protein